jgi:hypothetical protein
MKSMHTTMQEAFLKCKPGDCVDVHCCTFKGMFAGTLKITSVRQVEYMPYDSYESSSSFCTMDGATDVVYTNRRHVVVEFQPAKIQGVEFSKVSIFHQTVVLKNEDRQILPPIALIEGPGRRYECVMWQGGFVHSIPLYAGVSKEFDRTQEEIERVNEPLKDALIPVEKELDGIYDQLRKLEARKSILNSFVRMTATDIRENEERRGKQFRARIEDIMEETHKKIRTS